MNQATPDPKPETIPAKNGFKPLHIRNLIPGMLIGILIGIVGFLVYERHLPKVTQTLYTVTLTTFGVLIASFILIYAFKRQITNFIFGSTTANAGEVIDDAQKVTDALTDRFADTLLRDVPTDVRQRVRHVLPRLANWFIWSRFRNWWWQWLLGIFVSLGGLTGTLLLMNQNKLLENQNALIQRQMSLEEANRRSALVMLMSNIMDKVDDEIKEQRSDLLKKGLSKAEVDTMKFSLSQSLIGQIAALSHSFKPYRYMQGDSLIEKPLSPERGLLLTTLAFLPLDVNTLYKICRLATFNNSDLKNAALAGVNIYYVDLSGSDLSGVNLYGANLHGANLHGANLHGANLHIANLRKADLIQANLSNAYMSVANLNQADLSMADLSGADLRWVDFSFADLLHVHFAERKLSFNSLQTVKTLYNCKNLHDSLSIPLHKTHPHLFEPPKD